MHAIGERMGEISNIAIGLFILSGILFVIALFVFIMAFQCNQNSSKTNEERLTLLDEVMLIHTRENIE